MLADKGLHELIDAVRAINRDTLQCELWLCGFADVQNVSAVSGEQLRAWGEEPGIEWMGHSDAMESVYARIDCVVLPSYREGMPRSLLEAGAMGLPVVATDVPGCRNVVEHGVNGVLCEARNSDSLADAMRSILDMSEPERSAMGGSGRRLVASRFDERIIVEATVRAVESV